MPEWLQYVLLAAVSVAMVFFWRALKKHMPSD